MTIVSKFCKNKIPEADNLNDSSQVVNGFQDDIKGENNAVLVQKKFDNRPYVSIQIFGRTIVVLLDSGATHSIIGKTGMYLLEINNL